MSFPLVLHVLAAGLWLGCVLVEVFFERALAARTEYRETLAMLHRHVDLYVELPAFLIVAVTGAAMIAAATPTPALHAMTGFGGLAVLANAYCVRLVFQRQRYALAGDEAGYEWADRLQHKVGAVVLLGVVLAALAGLWNAW